jgi:hypothetical protein
MHAVCVPVRRKGGKEEGKEGEKEGQRKGGTEEGKEREKDVYEKERRDHKLNS